MSRFLSSIHHENLVECLELKITRCGFYDCVLLEFLTLRIFHSEPPAIHQLRFRFSYLGTDSCWGFHLWISAPVSCDSLYLPAWLSSLGPSSLLCDLTSLMSLRRVFHFFGLFNFLLVRMDFQALYKWKLEVCNFNFGGLSHARNLSSWPKI